MELHFENPRNQPLADYAVETFPLRKEPREAHDAAAFTTATMRLPNALKIKILHKLYFLASFFCATLKIKQPVASGF